MNEIKTEIVNEIIDHQAARVTTEPAVPPDPESAVFPSQSEAPRHPCHPSPPRITGISNPPCRRIEPSMQAYRALSRLIKAYQALSHLPEIFSLIEPS